MAWTVGRQNPLLIAPYPNMADARFTSALEVGVNNWANSGGATIVTGEGATGTYALRLNAAASTRYTYQVRTLTAFLKSYATESVSGDFYLYFRAKVKSYVADAYVSTRITWQTGAKAPISSVMDYWPIGNTNTAWTTGPAVPSDNTWRLYRNPTAVPAIPSNAVYIEIVLGYLSIQTADVYYDDIQFGHALDFQDLVGASYGAMALHPFEYKKIVPRSIRQNAYGRHACRRMNTGKYAGVLRSTTFTQGENAYFQSPGIYHSFIDYVADGTPFTLAYDQTETTRDYFSKCVLNQPGDGLEFINGLGTWKSALAWRESA